MRAALMVEQFQSRLPGGTGRYAAELTGALERTRGPTDELAGWVAGGPGTQLDLDPRPLAWDSVAAAEPSMRERRARYVGGGDYILFVGTSEPRKGARHVLDALSDPALKSLSLWVGGPRG